MTNCHRSASDVMCFRTRSEYEAARAKPVLWDDYAGLAHPAADGAIRVHIHDEDAMVAETVAATLVGHDARGTAYRFARAYAPNGARVESIKIAPRARHGLVWA